MEEHTEADERKMATFGEDFSAHSLQTAEIAKQQQIFRELKDQIHRGVLPLGRVKKTRSGQDGETKFLKLKRLTTRTFALFPVLRAFFH